ncbi:AIPR family protein [Phycicoccus sp. MAQZ13P-2]|uniref:AIPR family protein n=1 Tax=Phycicoccus mangrovi TaxID=2840470 RepID=UPI001C0022DB|nr:AIPR family protein [Phycicoccus mangrovi]MBT9275955.1 AIPR family protein [Phycicoccus mangrovi]
MTESSQDPDALLKAEVETFQVGTRTASAAMLAWFLQNVWRVEPEEVDSAICDGGGDKGIDALLVDDDLNEITVLQGKHRADPSKTTQGDGDLKNLVGAASWFDSQESVEALLAAKPNKELMHLLVRQEVAEKIAQGTHTVRLVFVTNADLDSAGDDYVAARHGMSPTLEVWDRKKLSEAAERTRRPDLRSEPVTLEANGTPITLELTDTEVMAIGVIPAKQLIKLPGISDRTLFSRNVRLFAGRTRINRELRKTVKTLGEHRLFPAYHNGLTLLTNKLEVDGTTISLEHVGVVNGCQSLITLSDNAESITDELQLLVKIIEVGQDGRVADLITYRSNNQNAVTLRDQRSSDGVMRDLQNGVQEKFGHDFGLQTRVGEDLGTKEVLENTLAAQLILAAYLGEPWAAVRKVRLFDQDYRRIFNRSVTPHRLWLLYLTNRAVENARPALRDDLRASFSSVRFTLVHLICEVLRLTDAGKQLLESPEHWLRDEEAKVVDALQLIAGEVVDTVNYHVKNEIADNEDYDPKVAFKSKGGVARLESDVIRDAKRQGERPGSYLFRVTPATT